MENSTFAHKLHFSFFLLPIIKMNLIFSHFFAVVRSRSICVHNLDSCGAGLSAMDWNPQHLRLLHRRLHPACARRVRSNRLVPRMLCCTRRTWTRITRCEYICPYTRTPHGINCWHIGREYCDALANTKIFPLSRLSDLIWKISLNYVWQAGRKTTFSQFAPPG